MNHAYILCGGEQKRWKASSPKQLVDIHGEPLIERTLRQLRNEEILPIISSSGDDFPFFRHLAQVRKSERTICHSLLSNVNAEEAEESNRVAVLCGDVVWPDAMIKRITRETLPVNVYGSFFTSEIFGFSFASDLLATEIVSKLRKAAHAGGRLWNFYRAMIEVPLDKHMLDANLWCEINDGFTTDFDFKDQYERWVKEHPK